MINKKAATLQQFFIGVVILVISAVVIFSLWFYVIQPFLYPAIDRQACHQSIVYRSSINFGPAQTSAVIPLNCKTEKICLGEKCEFGDKFEKVRLSSEEEKAKNQILERIANAMYDCHSMLGEGNLIFMPNKEWQKNYCLICSRIVPDENTQKLGSITYGELYEYLARKKTRDGESYLEFLHPGWKNWKNAEQLYENLKNQEGGENLEGVDFENWKINLDFENGYAVIAQMAPHGYFWSKFSGIATAVAIPVGAVLTATGIGAPVGVGLIVGSAAVGAASGGAVFWYTHPDGEYDYSPPVLIPYDVPQLNTLECSSFELAS